MKIVLTTPLYPPDIAEPASYIKELARRMSVGEETRIVTYGHLPEEVRGAKICVVSKRQPLIVRLLAFTRILYKASRDADILYVENGPSVELPALLVSFLIRARIVVHTGDKVAERQTRENFLLRILHALMRSRAYAVVHALPAERPEILPFRDYPKKGFEIFEQSWRSHLDELASLFRHA